MKTKSKKPRASKPRTETHQIESMALSTVKTREDIESIFQPNKLGYYDVHTSPIAWTAEDIAQYAVETMEHGQQAYSGAMRKVILTISAACESDPSIIATIKPLLTQRWAEQTVHGILSVAKMLPTFKSAGVDLNNVNDVMGLRDVSKTLKDADGDKRKVNAIVAKLNKGESPRKVKEHFSGGDESAPDPGHDGSFARKTREDELYKLARAVYKDNEGDDFSLKKIVAGVAGCLHINLNESEE